MNDAAVAGSGGHHGAFSLDDLELALPIDAIREVVPGARLLALPCTNDAVIGAVDLRGVVVPVLDLRRLLARPVAPIAYPAVVVVAHDARLLGLLASAVTGVLEPRAQPPNPIETPGAQHAILAASLQRDADGSQSSVLSPRGLFGLPGVPTAHEPPRTRAVQDDALPTMLLLLRSGSTVLAIDAIGIRSTLSDPGIEPSVLKGGACAGVVEYAGEKIAALELAPLLGLGTAAAPPAAAPPAAAPPAAAPPAGTRPPAPGSARRDALVLATTAGSVALLVDAVLEIVSVHERRVSSLPPFAMARAGLFRGLVSADALPAAIGADCLLLDAAALSQDAAIVGYAATAVPAAAPPTPAAGALPGAAAAGASTARRSQVLTYVACGEKASPIDDVSEILAHDADAAPGGTDGPWLGVTQLRGRTLTLCSLERCLGGRPTSDVPGAIPRTLVVDVDGDLIGFVVPVLHAIEASSWNRDASTPTLRSARRGAEGDDAIRLVAVGLGPLERLAGLVDLKAIGRALRARTLQPGGR
ncbi:MAG: chemotaxis protein CheW [Lautropia sp.]